MYSVQIYIYICVTIKMIYTFEFFPFENVIVMSKVQLQLFYSKVKLQTKHTILPLKLKPLKNIIFFKLKSDITLKPKKNMKQTGRKQYDYQYKFVMVGDSAVGKSSLLLRFADNQFNENYMITIGVDFRFKSVNVNNKIIKMQIWDTAGQERFRTIVNTYYKNSHAVYLIFDLTNKDSFMSIRNYWINEVQSYTDDSAVLILVGNKSDCPNRAVSNQQIESFVKSKHLHYFQTSAKNSTNVSEMFINIAQFLTEKKLQGGKVPVGAGQDGARKLENNAVQNGGSGSNRYNCNC